MSDHAKLSPSGASRWMNCPGSVRLHQNTTSNHAEEGTLAHHIAETALYKGLDAIGPDNFPNTMTLADMREMEGYVKLYYEYVQRLGEHKDAVLLVEQKVDISRWVPDSFGTVDAIILTGDTLHIVDFKYGVGVEVSAEDNPQLQLYGLGALDYVTKLGYDNVRKVIMHIVQPRIDNFSRASMKVKDLLATGQTFAAAAKATEDPNAPFCPGLTQCQWCSAIARCPAQKQLFMEVAEKSEEIAPEDLTDEEIASILAKQSIIKKWLGKVAVVAKSRARDGHQIPQFKLAYGNSKRQWRDIEEAREVLERLLGEKAYKTELLSVNQAEKSLGPKLKKEVEGLVKKTRGGLVLVPESSKKLAVTDIHFDNEDE